MTGDLTHTHGDSDLMEISFRDLDDDENTLIGMVLRNLRFLNRSKGYSVVQKLFEIIETGSSTVRICILLYFLYLIIHL